MPAALLAASAPEEAKGSASAGGPAYEERTVSLIVSMY
jgi:hypothetical protein